eukprot:CAMPEP_0205947938 /NCGR_PEP_ID=MMETSP1459-20131121/320_1 /ASSEMBLY_ACC=CAM_ASM_001120 /TAXON_ID=41880 /ORGANISM="Pycnococcus provasolii, Strain RCC931" /LENGTH=187 /DNA_ID=CAMNT_0053319097 /DNA_START=27 /DNA_END=591 /DNA_ORIENTATION=-
MTLTSDAHSGLAVHCASTISTRASPALPARAVRPRSRVATKTAPALVLARALQGAKYARHPVAGKHPGAILRPTESAPPPLARVAFAGRAASVVLLAAFSEGSSPHALIMTSKLGSPDLDPHASIARTTFMPSMTCPKTVCLPSSHGVASVHMKNWLPFVFGPAFAMDRIPDPVCFKVKFSSSNVRP